MYIECIMFYHYYYIHVDIKYTLLHIEGTKALRLRCHMSRFRAQLQPGPGLPGDDPLVNIQKTMENHHFEWVNHGKSIIYMAIFHSYVSLPEGKTS